MNILLTGASGSLGKEFTKQFEKRNLNYFTQTNSIDLGKNNILCNFNDPKNLSLIKSHIKKNKPWNESSCICIEKNGKFITLGEFQVHNHRDCIKFRWCFKVLLTEFAEYFNITAI